MITVFPDEGLLIWLNNGLNNTYKLKLFVNDITPDRDTVLGDYTEASFTGYAETSLSLADWVNQGMIGHTAFAAPVPQTFVNTSASPEDAYGWYLTDNAEALVIASARFDSAPFTFLPLVGTLDVTPAVGDFSEKFSS